MNWQVIWEPPSTATATLRSPGAIYVSGKVASYADAIDLAKEALESGAGLAALALATEGANGTLSDANRQAVADQLIGIRDQVLSLANQTYQGSYVFAGTASSTQPFVLDATQPDGVKYNGNTHVNSVTISQGHTIPVNVPGSQIFTNPAGDVLGSLNGLITALQTNTGLPAANTANRLRYGIASPRAFRVVFIFAILPAIASIRVRCASNALALMSNESNIAYTTFSFSAMSIC